MGNQPQKYNSDATTLRSGGDNDPPPRPQKPTHLQRPRIDTLPVTASDPRAFFLPHGDLPLKFSNSPCDASPSEISPTSGIYETVDSTEIQSESIPLSELVDEYGSQLPLRFCVSESLYGVAEESSLMEGQLLNGLFEKETKVVEVTAHTGANYIVPLNSSLKFSILYNPYNKLETAKKGYLFSRVSDVIDALPVPQAVAVTKAFQCNDDGNILLVLEGQVLIIIDVVQCKESRTRKLKCFMVERSTTIMIDERIEGAFSTNTSMLKVRLASIIEYISLPVSMILENSENQRVHLPLHATVGFYTITNQRTQKSIVVSSKSNHQDELIEILLNVPIEAHLVKTSQQQLHLLRKQAQLLYKSFHPSKLNKVIVDANSSMNYIQTMLFKVVPENDTWMHGIEMFPPQPPSTSFPNPEPDSDADDFLDMSMDVSVSSPPTSSMMPSLIDRKGCSSSALHAPVQAFKRNQPNVHDRPPLPIPHSHSSDTISSHLDNNGASAAQPFKTMPRMKPNHNHDPVPYLIVRETQSGALTHEEPYQYVKLSHERKSEMAQLKQRLTELENTNTQLTSHIKELTEESSKAPIPAPIMSLYDTSVTESNRKVISKYSCQELLEVLDCIGLGQYKDSFRREDISGTLFVDLDEEILEQELNVKSKIHRIKIMRLVTGRQSVVDLKKQVT